MSQLYFWCRDSAFFLFVQCCEFAFGVVTLHFAYKYNVATLSVDVATDDAVGVVTLELLSSML